MIAQQRLELNVSFACSHGLLNPPADTGRGILALGLGEGAVDGDEELTFRVDGIDILLLEDDRNPEATELTGVVQGIHRISGEAGDRFGKNHIDLALPALTDHTQKVFALTGRCAGLALIGEDVHHCPVGVRHDLLRIVGFLIFVAVELLLAVGGHTAIGRNSQVFLLFQFLCRFLFCGDDNHFWSGLVLRHAWVPPSIH